MFVDRRRSAESAKPDTPFHDWKKGSSCRAYANKLQLFTNSSDVPI